MIVPDDLKAGDGLTLDYENAVLDAVRAGQVKCDPSSGLTAMVTAFGTFLRKLGAAEGWYKVMSQTTTPGTYILLEQLDGPAGAWLAGARTIAARELNGNTPIPSGKFVRAWRGRAGWLFAYGAC